MQGHGAGVKLGLSTESCSEKGELSRSADGAAAAWKRAVQRETGSEREGAARGRGQQEGGGSKREGGRGREGGSENVEHRYRMPHLPCPTPCTPTQEADESSQGASGPAHSMPGATPIIRQPKLQAEVQNTPGGGTAFVSPIKPTRAPPHRGQDPKAATSTPADI